MKHSAEAPSKMPMSSLSVVALEERSQTQILLLVGSAITLLHPLGQELPTWALAAAVVAVGQA